MGFLKRFFGSAVEQAESVDAAITTCQFESSNKECSLVQQLKDKQTQKRAVDNKIKSYDECSRENIASFFNLLVKMEKSGFEMGTHSYHPSLYGGGDCSRISSSFEHRFGVTKLEGILASMRDEEVSAIGTELNALKAKAIVLSDMRYQSEELGKEIATIKAQLGIE